MKTIQLPHLSKYLIREDGEVISIWSEPKILKGGIDKDGYRKFVLIDDLGARRYLRRATLVCTAFHGPRPPKNTVRHMDGSRTNDAAYNLAWGTQSQNCMDKVAHGTAQRGENNSKCSITEAVARAIKSDIHLLRTKEIAEKYGVSKNIVNSMKYGKAWGWL